MGPHTSLEQLVVSVMIWLLAMTFRPCNAAVVFDDHFEGNSGALPASWSGEGEGSVVELGTTVTLHDDFVMWTNADFNPNESGTTTIRIMVGGTTNHTGGGLIDFAQWDNHFWIKLHAQDGKIEVKASDVASGEEEYTVGYVPAYAGGAIQLIVVLNPESFSVSTDVPPFSSGSISYHTVFTSFTRADLGSSAKLVIDNECAPYVPPCSSTYDRVTLEVGALTPVESVTMGRIKALYRR